jgi:hypothetical protein
MAEVELQPSPSERLVPETGTLNHSANATNDVAWNCKKLWAIIDISEV